MILPKKAIAALKPYTANSFHGDYKAKLDANESPYDIPPGIKRLIFREMKEVKFNRYPDPNALELRKAFSRKINFPVSNILTGNGSDELILYIALAFAKKKILFSSPTFAMYRVIGISSGAKAVDIPLEADFGLPVENILNEKDADIVFISSPNNPTGNCFDREDVLEIIKNSKCLVVIDEAYTEFCKSSFFDELKKFNNLIILRTFSKAFGLAGLRIGFMISHPYIIQEVNKVRLPYNLSLFSQTAGRIVIENNEFLRHIVRTITSERERVFRELCCIDELSPYPSEANFILFKTNFSSDKLYECLEGRGILVRNINGYRSLKNCVRVTIGTEQENDFFLKALKKFVREQNDA